MIDNIEDIRNAFPMLQKIVNERPLVYLDTAASALKPYCVIDAISNFYENEYSTVHRAIYTTAARATDLYENSREKIARYIGATSSDEIIFTRGATSSLNLFAQAFSSTLQEGDEILISEMEHHSNIVPWQAMRDRYKLSLKVIPFLDNGELDIEKFVELVTPRTKVVSICHMSNVLGTINPIKEIAARAHECGAVVMVDAAQSVSHVPIDVAALEVDFLVFSSHKLYGPTGLGILYGKKELLAQLPPFELGSDMIEEVTFERSTFTTPPIKFEPGTPIIAGVIGLGAAIDFVTQIGVQNMQAYEEMVSGYLHERLREIRGIRILGTSLKKGPLASFVVDGVHSLDLATLIDCKSVAIRSGHLCAQPTLRRFGVSSACRVSLGIYNTKRDIDQCIEALHYALNMV